MTLRDIAQKFIATIDPTTATGRIEINTILVFLQAIDDTMQSEMQENAAARDKSGGEAPAAEPAAP